jgi:hypothetical protein
LLARRWTLVATGALVVITALAVHPTWARSLGADVWNMPALTEQVRTTETEGTRLAAEDTEVQRRIAIKDAIVTELLAGRITLADATDQFTAMNTSRPHYMAAIRDTFPGATDREKMARNVISFATPRVAGAAQSATASRLEAELQQMLANGASR